MGYSRYIGAYISGNKSSGIPRREWVVDVKIDFRGIKSRLQSLGLSQDFWSPSDAVLDKKNSNSL